MVARHEKVLVPGRRETDHLGIPLGAQKDADRWVLVRVSDLFGKVVDVEAELPRVRGLELP